VKSEKEKSSDETLILSLAPRAIEDKTNGKQEKTANKSRVVAVK
jgi:hypothetical protein